MAGAEKGLGKGVRVDGPEGGCAEGGEAEHCCFGVVVLGVYGVVVGLDGERWGLGCSVAADLSWEIYRWRHGCASQLRNTTMMTMVSGYMVVHHPFFDDLITFRPMPNKSCGRSEDGVSTGHIGLDQGKMTSLDIIPPCFR